MATEAKETVIHGPENFVFPEPVLPSTNLADLCGIDMDGRCQNPSCLFHLSKISIEEKEARDKEERERERKEAESARKALVVEAQLLLGDIYGEDKCPVLVICKKERKIIIMDEEDLDKGMRPGFRAWFLSEVLKKTVQVEGNNWKLIDHLVKLEMQED